MRLRDDYLAGNCEKLNSSRPQLVLMTGLNRECRGKRNSTRYKVGVSRKETRFAKILDRRTPPNRAKGGLNSKRTVLKWFCFLRKDVLPTPMNSRRLRMPCSRHTNCCTDGMTVVLISWVSLSVLFCLALLKAAARPHPASRDLAETFHPLPSTDKKTTSALDPIPSQQTAHSLHASCPVS